MKKYGVLLLGDLQIAMVVFQMSVMLNRLDIKHTINISVNNGVNEAPRYRIMVRGPERVEEFINKVGFHNPVQITRYLVWKKFGFCPPKIGIEKRKLILNGKLDPKYFYRS